MKKHLKNFRYYKPGKFLTAGARRTVSGDVVSLVGGQDSEEFLQDRQLRG